MKPVPPFWAPADSRPSNAGILKHVLTFLGDGWVYSRMRFRSDVALIAATVALPASTRVNSVRNDDSGLLLPEDALAA